MKNTNMKLGPLALILTVISICMAILAILSYTTAHADKRLAEKYADNIAVRYQLEREGQKYLADVCGSLADGTAGYVPDESGIIWNTIQSGDDALRIGIEPTEDGVRTVYWRQEHAWEPNTDIGQLWTGE